MNRLEKLREEINRISKDVEDNIFELLNNNLEGFEYVQVTPDEEFTFDINIKHKLSESFYNFGLTEYGSVFENMSNPEERMTNTRIVKNSIEKSINRVLKNPKAEDLREENEKYFIAIVMENAFRYMNKEEHIIFGHFIDCLVSKSNYKDYTDKINDEFGYDEYVELAKKFITENKENFINYGAIEIGEDE